MPTEKDWWTATLSNATQTYPFQARNEFDAMRKARRIAKQHTTPGLTVTSVAATPPIKP